MIKIKQAGLGEPIKNGSMPVGGTLLGEYIKMKYWRKSCLRENSGAKSINSSQRW